MCRGVAREEFQHNHCWPCARYTLILTLVRIIAVVVLLRIIITIIIVGVASRQAVETDREQN